MKKRTSFLWMLLFVLIGLPQALYATHTAADKAAIKAGNILHCFDWKFTDIQAELSAIQDAGFNTIQTSVAQKNYGGQQNWNDIYRPWDTSIGNGLGTQAELTALCAAAHARNMYIIVDVVANHTDGDGQTGTPYGGMAPFWLNQSIYHCNVGGANDGNRWIATHGNIGMPDLKTEDSNVQQKFVQYVALLKSCGVDGIRWDAAKHIGLPSEGDNFWSVVIDNSMYNYGEVLNTTAGNNTACLKEYQQYGLSITDNQYSTHQVLGAFKGGNVPQSSGCWTYDTQSTMFVYWGESHDTYLNRGDASEYTDQNVVDRAYAVAAAHNDIPGLYLSRPSKPAKVGVKGSTHFMSNEVAEVNHLKNLCAGEPEYYSQSNGACSITRNSGAVIVKGSGSGQVSVPNGGGYLPAGQYVDHVSGATFNVTATTISGSVGQSGIAVLYNGSATQTPRATIAPNGGSFTTETLSVTLTGSNCTSVWYQIGTGARQTVAATTATFTIGAGVAFGTSITVNYGASDGTTESSMGTAVFVKKDPNAVSRIYLKNAAGWSAAYVYAYSGTSSNAQWPGEAMTAVSGQSDYDFVYTLPENLEDGCNIIFTESRTATDHRYPADGAPGLVYTSGDMLFNNSTHSWTVYTGGVTPPIPPTPQNPTATISPDGGDFSTPTLAVNVQGNHCDSVWYQVGSATPVKQKGSTATLMIGADMTAGQSVVVRYGAIGAVGTTPYQASATFTKVAPSVDKMIYLKNAANWSTAYIYAYIDGGAKNAAWPGVPMTAVQGKADYDFEYILPESLRNGCKVIFSDHGSSQNRYPADQQPGLTFSGENMLFNNGTNAWTAYDGQGGGDEPVVSDQLCLTSSDQISVWFVKPASWSEVNTVNVYAWGNGGNITGNYPGQQMTQINDTLFMYTFSTEPQKLKFNNTTTNPWKQTVDLDFTRNAVYVYQQAAGQNDNCVVREVVSTLCAPTDVEKLVLPELRVEKVLINGQLYLRVDNHLYDTTGRIIQ